jgi:hypothetical protein
MTARFTHGCSADAMILANSRLGDSRRMTYDHVDAAQAQAQSVDRWKRASVTGPPIPTPGSADLSVTGRKLPDDTLDGVALYQRARHISSDVRVAACSTEREG